MNERKLSSKWEKTVDQQERAANVRFRTIALHTPI